MASSVKPFNQGALDKMEGQRIALENTLSSSSTAYRGDTPPTGSDVATDLKLSNLKNAIRTMKGQQLKEDWYGKANTSPGDPTLTKPENSGFLTRALTDLQKPLYGVVGAAESLFGKGVKPDVIGNITENMQTGHRDFGDLLRSGGAPKWVSAPLGFAADVIFDPVNIATLGSASLVGKVGSGLVRGTAKEGLIGGLEAAKTGFTSSMGQDLLNIGKYVPRIPYTAKKLAKTEIFSKASDRIWNEAERYNFLTGKTDPLEGLGKGIYGGNATTGVTLGNYVQSVVERIPGGVEFIDKFKYDPYKYMQLVKLKDKVLKLTAKNELSTVDADPGALLRNTSGFDPSKIPAGTSAELTDLQTKLNDGLDDSVHIAQQGPDSAIHADNMEDFEARMIAEGENEGLAKADIQKFVRMNSQKTGMKFYDDLSDKVADKLKSFKIRDKKVGEGLFNAIEFATKFFKTAKVPMNVASHTNAVVGNVVMDAMAGWDVTKSVPFVTKAYDFLRGRSGAQFILDNFLQEAGDYSKFVAANPNAFKGTYGFNPSMVGGKYFLDKVLQDGRATGLITAKNEKEVMEAMARMPDELRGALENAAEAQGAEKGSLTKSIQSFLKENKKLRTETPTELVAKDIKEGAIPSDPSSAIRDLHLTGGVGMDYIKKKASEGNVAYKILQGAMEKATSIFERHDQASKLGKALYATREGLTLAELKKLSRMVPEGITRGDVVSEVVVAGQKRYRLSWDKATDLVNETNMNYSAMPAFVRMMRSMPILGAPFISFTYAAIPKTAKTLYHNPEAFNKINFLLSSLSGDKTPAEKENMKSKYSQWFKSPGLFRVPFTDSHPAYLNIANMLPYYSLSLWNPSQRTYSDTLPSAIVQTIDKLQLFKDPAGQVMFDYLILPFLLSEQERPTSQFGQPLYPISATGIEKVGYAARTLGEAYVPGVAGAAGVVGGLIAPKATPFIPSYGYRKLSNAVQQKNALGIPSRDSSGNLVLKGLAGLAGLQYNNMDLTYLQNKSKEKK